MDEHDLELLDAALDGELTPEAKLALAARLAGEPALASAHEQLEAERQLRASFYQSLEATDDQVDALMTRILTAKPRRPITGLATAAVGALAASLLLGFLLGRDSMVNQRSTPPGRVASVAPRRLGVGANDGAESRAPTVQTVLAYQVALRDAHGRVVALQAFDSLEKAQSFALDVERWHERQDQLQRRSQIVVADRF